MLISVSGDGISRINFFCENFTFNVINSNFRQNFLLLVSCWYRSRSTKRNRSGEANISKIEIQSTTQKMDDSL